jgi:hypothetical protein
MSVEWYAPVVILVGVYLWIWGSVLGSVIAVLFFSLFGGGAALIIGHSTVQPADLMLVFMLAHVLLSMFTRTDHVNVGLKVNGYMAFYAIYGFFSAFTLPKIFARHVYVVPMTANERTAPYMMSPVGYSSQNITQALYMIAALVGSVCAATATRDPRSRRSVVISAVVISWIHIGFGLIGGVLGSHGGSAIIRLFRNATYAETFESLGGYSRISGVFPEPSDYGHFAFVWFVFMTELWLRGVSRRMTLITSVALALMIVACTSSSSYAAMALYALMMAMRFAIVPRSFRAENVVPVALILMVLVTLLLAVFALDPHLFAMVARVLHGLTLGKFDTASGQGRLFWSATSLRAFEASGGLGVGVGSLRSSGLLFAILGSVGVLGLLAYVGHFLKILQPLQLKTYDLPGAPADAVGVAAAWAACAGMLPGLVAAPTPAPGMLFSVLGGLALGWRYAPEYVRATLLTGRRAARGPAEVRLGGT